MTETLTLLKRRPKVLTNVQSLRAVAAALVVLDHVGGGGGIESHYFPAQLPFFRIFGIFGLFGVDIFFVISGFIIVTTASSQFAKRGASLAFLRRRFTRIYPPYWLVLIPMTAVYLIDPARLSQFHPVHDNLFASFLLLPQLTHPLVAVSWTLVFEVYFYVIFSFLLFFQRQIVAPAMAVWFGCQILLFFRFNGSNNAYLAFLGNPICIEFIFGVIVGLIYLNGRMPLPRTASGAALAICAVLWIFSLRIGDMPGIERIFVWGLPAMLLVYGAVAIERAGIVRSPKWLISLGDSSYALYLWHLPVLIAIAQLAHSHFRGFGSHLLLILAMLIFVVAYSVAIYVFVESPMTRYLNRLLTLSERPKLVRQDAS